MPAILLPEDIEQRLERLAESTGRTKTWYAREAIVSYLEDLDDIYLALERLEAKAPRVGLEELERELGLED